MSELKEKMQKDYIDYALSVITDRALPDVRDNLKPVQRRILYDMLDLGITSDKPYRKTARTVGDTMARFHAHGDSSIYGALITMSRPWICRYPLIDFRGNNGSIDGDGAAAMRYTEARLSPLGMEMLKDIQKDTVDMKDNFDATEKEPIVLPSRIPNLFLNGIDGIAVGMACNLASYNLVEVVNGICAYLKDENITIEELLNYITAPDFATGCEIVNQSELCTVLGAGIGKIKVRARYNIEAVKGNREQLVFYEVPPQVQKESMVNKIIDLVNQDKLDGIYDVRDETDKENIRIVIELKKNMIPENVAEQLYQKTPLQINFNLNNNVLVDGKPKVLGLLDMIREWCKFQLEVILRKSQFDLNKKQYRLHVLEGLCKALDNIDKVVETIKSSRNTEEALYKLMCDFSLTEVQSKSVLDIKLSRLIKIEKIKLLEEKSKIEEEILELEKIISSEEERKKILSDDLRIISSKYGDNRRTAVSNIAPFDEDNLLLVAKEDVAVIYSQNNYIKSVKMSDYKLQNRGGQGIRNNEEEVKVAIQTNTMNSLLVVTEKGVMFKLAVAKIPLCKNNQKGISIYNLLPIDPSDKVSKVVDLSEINKDFIVFATKKGFIKKSSTELYKKFRSNGSKAISLDEDDVIVDINFISDGELYSMFSKNGRVVTFNISKVRPVGRVARGVCGMKIGTNDGVISAMPLTQQDTIALFSENGLGKKMNCSELVVKNRGGKGILCYKITKRTGNLMSVQKIQENNNVLIIGDNKTIAIESKSLPLLRRASSGSIIIRGSKVLSVVIY